MNARQINLLALTLGALALALSLYAALHTGSQAWRLHQRISASKLAQLNQNQEAVLPSLYLMQAASHGAAGAALLARLRKDARQARVSLQRAEPRAADKSDPQKVKISARASGRSRDIAAFLYAIEAKPPALIIERARFDGDKNDQVSIDILVTARVRTLAGTR